MIECFRVAPGSVTALSVTGGDRFEVIDRHGRQAVELTVLAADPRAVSGLAPDAPATVLRGLVAGPDENGDAAGRIRDCCHATSISTRPGPPGCSALTPRRAPDSVSPSTPTRSCSSPHPRPR